MRLDVAGASVELSLSGYQFPDLEPPYTDGDGDADWLVVSGTIHSNGRRWDFQDPCLTAPEAGELGRWLRAIAEGGGRDERNIIASLTFTEPELAFECELVSGEDAIIRVLLSWGAAPAEGGDNGGGDEARVVTMPMSLIDIGLAADEWDRECARYPRRTR